MHRHAAKQRADHAQVVGVDGVAAAYDQRMMNDVLEIQNLKKIPI